MTYQEALDFLNGNFVSFQTAGRTAYKGGLEAITGMCRAMGDPQRDYLSIHIAGTNGKGSVAHMLASVLQAAGYRTGLYTSPHLHDFRERIRVDGEMIPQEKVAAFLDRYGKEMTERGLSYFEMTTAMAFHRFSEAGVEVAVVETGLGGRLDATNVLQPILSIITNIGLDHSDILGPTVAHIAAEKAGIIKPGIPVLVGETDPESAPVFTARTAECGSPLVFADRTYECTGSTLRPPLQYCTLRRIGDGAGRLRREDRQHDRGFGRPVEFGQDRRLPEEDQGVHEGRFQREILPGGRLGADDGLRGERHGAARRSDPGLRHLLCFFGLHETRRAPFRADAPARDLCLDTRLVPRGRGWPDAPARRT